MQDESFEQLIFFKPGARRPHAWFLSIVSVRMYARARVCVCVRPRGY